MIKNIKVGPRGEILEIYDYRKSGTFMTDVPEDAIERPYYYFWDGHKVSYTTKFVDENTIFDKKNEYRAWRSRYLGAYDRLGLYVLRGDYNPSTFLPYEPITEEEKQWRVLALNFTEIININTTEQDYPQPSNRLKSI